MRRRIVAVLFTLGLVLGLVLPQPEGVSMPSLTTNGPYLYLADTTTGYYYGDASGGEAYAYIADQADTTGKSYKLTCITDTADTCWYRANLPTNTYDILWRDDTETLWVAQNIPIWTDAVGESTIADSLDFGADVVPSAALRDWSVHTAHIDSAAVTKFKIAASAVDSSRIAPASIHPAHLHEPFNPDSMVVIRIDVDTLNADTLWAIDAEIDTIHAPDLAGTNIQIAQCDSIILPADAIVGAGLDVTGGKVALDVTPSSGSATLIEEEDALQVKYDASALDEGASGLTVDIVPSGGGALQSLTTANDGLDILVGGIYDSDIHDSTVTYAQMARANNPVAEGDLWTFQSSGNVLNFRDIGALNGLDLDDVPAALSGETDNPGDAVTGTWDVYHEGAEVGDYCGLIFTIGPPAWRQSGNTPFSYACSCAVADTLTFWHEPKAVVYEGSTRIGYILIKNWPH